MATVSGTGTPQRFTNSPQGAMAQGQPTGAAKLPPTIECLHKQFIAAAELTAKLQDRLFLITSKLDRDLLGSQPSNPEEGPEVHLHHLGGVLSHLTYNLAMISCSVDKLEDLVGPRPHEG